MHARTGAPPRLWLTHLLLKCVARRLLLCQLDLQCAQLRLGDCHTLLWIDMQQAG